MNGTPCDPNFAPSVFHLFVPTKKHLTRNPFASDADMKQAPHPLVMDTWHQFILLWDPSLGAMKDNCLNFIGDYTEVWCVPPAINVSHIRQNENKVINIRVFATIFHVAPLCRKINYHSLNEWRSYTSYDFSVWYLPCKKRIKNVGCSSAFCFK
jgi:hypothetical protein